MAHRDRIAARFGKIEHEAGRLLPVPIILSFGFILIGKIPIALAMTVLSFIIWVIYITSHTLEKLFYGPGLRKYGKR